MLPILVLAKTIKLAITSKRVWNMWIVRMRKPSHLPRQTHFTIPFPEVPFHLATVTADVEKLVTVHVLKQVLSNISL